MKTEKLDTKLIALKKRLGRVVVFTVGACDDGFDILKTETLEPWDEDLKVCTKDNELKNSKLNNSKNPEYRKLRSYIG